MFHSVREPQEDEIGMLFATLYAEIKAKREG
jgi:hypothetical protein